MSYNVIYVYLYIYTSLYHNQLPEQLWQLTARELHPFGARCPDAALGQGLSDGHWRGKGWWFLYQW